MDTTDIAVLGTFATALTGFFWRLWAAQMKEHREMRKEDREDRKELIGAVTMSGEKTASGIHDLNVTMSAGFARLDEKINGMTSQPFDRTKTDEDLPPVRSIRASTQKEG